MKSIKDILREIFITLHIDLTKNLKYDRLTRKIIHKYVRKDFNCIDVGCHKGEILDLILQQSPDGKHFAFEPIPYLFEELTSKYGTRTKVFPFALSDSNEETVFHIVKNAPAYSGIKKRRYEIENPIFEEIKVKLHTLDEIFPTDQKIDFIKIDVEGGEFGVLKGGKNLLKANKPLVLFECGTGASDCYGTSPLELFDFISQEIGLGVYTLHAFLNNKEPMSSSEFENCFITNSEYYFVAAVPQKIKS